jgi:pectinesterase
MKTRLVPLAALLAFLNAVQLSGADVAIAVKNDLPMARPSETIVLQWADLSPVLGKTKADRVIVLDSDGKQVAAQPIFFHGQKKPADQLVFQADFAPGQQRTFTIKPGIPAPYDPKVYGRWVPERNDDYAWENDRIAYRIYGPLLEKVEPACSGVDVWPKKTRGLIINKWYQLAQSINQNYYHTDHGEGLDCYKVGHEQGCGGTAIWSDGKKFTTGTKGWQKQKTIANGPVRLIFELTYDPIDVNGIKISEIKRVTLDAGQNLNHYECTFTTDKPDPDLTIAPGIMEHADRPCTTAMHKDQGWMTNWDAGDTSPATKDNGHVGVSLVIDPAAIKDMMESDGHLLVLTKATSGIPVSFWSGAGWDRSGDFATSKDWDDYNQQWARRIGSPLKITISNLK